MSDLNDEQSEEPGVHRRGTEGTEKKTAFQPTKGMQTRFFGRTFS